MFSNGAALKTVSSWGGAFLVISFLGWFALAATDNQEAVDGGIDHTHGLVLWMADFTDLVPGMGWATDFFLNQANELPKEIFVNKYVVDKDDSALLEVWMVWAALALAIWLVVMFLSVVASTWKDFSAGWRGVIPAARTTTAAAAATVRAADNEWTERIWRLKLLWAPAWLVFLIAPFVLSVIIPMIHNLYVDPDWTVWPEVLAVSIWHASTSIASATGKIVLVVVALGVIAVLGIGAVQATILTSRRNLPVGTHWRGIDSAYMASAFVVEAVMLLGILFFIIGL